MLIKKQGSSFMGGPADIICILKLPTGRFHVAFFEEHPMPGPIQPISKLSIIRLKSKMHHTDGAETFEEARQHLEELREKIELPDANIIDDVAIEVEDPVSVWPVQNWTTGKISLKNAIGK